ncbi:MAG: LptF/LptG family permease [Candidatus Omnitrophica bacterium]|nr:LptF/LptG family permease [Candidatus Omnitrophota bacterium]
MRILRNYILKECLVPFIVSMLLLNSVFLLGSLVRLTNLVINKGVALSTIGEAFLWYIPMLVGYTLPIACMISIIIAFSRMSADNEIIAIRASGVHLGRILFAICVLGVLMSLVAFIFNDRIVPHAHHRQRVLLKQLGVKNPTALLEPGMFVDAFEGQILFIHKIDGNKFYNITIYQPQEDGPTRTIIARQGEFTPIPGTDKIKLKLIDGTSDEPGGENSNSFYKLNFDTYFMTLDFSKKDDKIKKKPKSMSLKELRAEQERLERLMIEDSRIRTEFYRKITWSFAPFFFMVLGFPIAVITHRREKSANILLAVMCVVIYYLLTLGCEALASKGGMDPAWIMWMPDIVAGLAALILNYRCVS